MSLRDPNPSNRNEPKRVAIVIANPATKDIQAFETASCKASATRADFTGVPVGSAWRPA